MRLSQIEVNELTKNWGITIPTVANYNWILAAKGQYVYCQGASEGSIQKRARADGSLIWEKDFNVSDLSREILVDSQQNLYTSSGGNVYKYDNDGDILWTKDVIEGSTNDVILQHISSAEDEILVTGFVGGSNRVFILSASTGEILLTIADKCANTRRSSKFLSSGDIVGFSTLSPYYRIKRWARSDGSIIWTSTSSFEITATITIDADDNIWAIRYSSPNYYISKISKSTGNELLATFIGTLRSSFHFYSSDNSIVLGIYNDSTDVLTINKYDVDTGVLLATQDFSNITAYNNAVITK